MTSKTICTKEGCTEVRARQTGNKTWCKTHNNEYSRLWRTRNTTKTRKYNLAYNLKHEGDTYITGNGYMFYVGFNHPACSETGLTYMHRIVMWDKLAGKDVPCTDCGGMLYWGLPFTHPSALAVDHVDENRQNNDALNLEPVHKGCNTSRAAKNRAKRKAIAAEVAA